MAVEVVEAVLAWPCDVGVLAASTVIVTVLHVGPYRCTRHANEASAAESMACKLARHHNAELPSEDGDVVRSRLRLRPHARSSPSACCHGISACAEEIVHVG